VLHTFGPAKFSENTARFKTGQNCAKIIISLRKYKSVTHSVLVKIGSSFKPNHHKKIELNQIGEMLCKILIYSICNQLNVITMEECTFDHINEKLILLSFKRVMPP